MIIIAWNWYPFVLFSHIKPSSSVFSHEHQTSWDINNTDGLTHLKSIATNSYYLDGIGHSAVTKTRKILVAYSAGWCGLGVALQGHTGTWSTRTSVMAQAVNEDVVNHVNHTLASKVSSKWCVSVVLTFYWLNQITWPYPTSDGAGKGNPSWTQREENHKCHHCVTCGQALSYVLCRYYFYWLLATSVWIRCYL